MAARGDESPTLTASLSFEESEESDYDQEENEDSNPPNKDTNSIFEIRVNHDNSLTRTDASLFQDCRIDSDATNKDSGPNKYQNAGIDEAASFCSLSDTEWTVQEKCGEHTVYITHAQRPGVVYFAHVIPLDHMTSSQLSSFHHVMSIFEKQLSGDYMLNISDMCVEKRHNHLLVIYENCEGGTLHALISRAKRYDEVLNEIEIQDWLVQLLLALKHLHTHGVKHLNITCSSLLLKTNSIRLTEPSQLKWLYKKPESAHTVKQSDVIVTIETDDKLAYTAPEVICDKPVTEKADIWSVGCVLYEMCARKRMFRAKSAEELHNKITSGKLPKWPKGFPSHLESIWKRMMRLDPNKRLSVREILQEPEIAEHLEDMQLSIVTPCPVPMTSYPGAYIPRRSPMPQVMSVEYEINSDDDELRLTEEDTMRLLGIDTSGSRA